MVHLTCKWEHQHFSVEISITNGLALVNKAITLSQLPFFYLIKVMLKLVLLYFCILFESLKFLFYLAVFSIHGKTLYLFHTPVFLCCVMILI